MKNVFLSLSFLMLLNFSHAQWTTDSSGALFTSQTLKAGVYNTGVNPFRMWFDSNTDEFTLVLRNASNKGVFAVSNYGSNTYFNLKNKYGSELYKVSTFGGDNTMFMHLPKADSRIVVGGYGDYLQSEGHKLVVRNGSAKIEGNFFSNGNIGIGTMSFVDGSDTYRLSVDGRVRAHAVKVYTDWADYVFEDTYKLPSLEEVEDYIEQNGHLKDIPSAKEVEENGIELGEMNKLLLQKIEELTLYTIELKKEIDALKSKID